MRHLLFLVLISMLIRVPTESGTHADASTVTAANRVD